MNRFALVNIVTKRAKQIENGAEPRVLYRLGGNVVPIAVREVEHGQIRHDYHGSAEDRLASSGSRTRSEP